MARYIDADRLINEFTGNGGVFTYGPKLVAAIASRINLQPTADVVEVKHGEWLADIQKITTPAGIEFNSQVGYKCSLCGRTEKRKEPYCNCGAKMNGGNK